MKLTDLNVAIRDLKGNPQITLRLSPDDTVGLPLTVEKSKLLAALKERFVERSAETNLRLRDDGFLSTETNDGDL